MKDGLVYLRPTQLAYVRVTGPYDDAAPRAWERMFQWLDKHGLLSPVGRGFGLMRDNPNSVAPENCRYDACIELESYFEEIALREIRVQMLPGGSYVRLRRIGNYGAMRCAAKDYYSAFEAPRGLQLEDRRPLITIFLDNPGRCAPERLRADVCIPVTANRSAGQEAG